MAGDPLSPIAPARIRALLLPIGRIKRSRFLAYVDLLQQQSLVRLGDISPDPRPDRNMFSPLAFPRGTLLYDLSPSLPPTSQLSLSPFEQFREPLLVIGIGDASEYPWLEPSRGQDGKREPTFNELLDEDKGARELHSSVEDLREQFPRAYLHSLMMFESASQLRHPQLPEETRLIPPRSQLGTTTMKTVMCDITSTLLAEMTTLAKSIQALPSVASPASQNGMAGNTPSWANADYAASQFSRRNSQVPSTSRPASPLSHGQKDLHRMSMPVLSTNSGGLLNSDDPRALASNNHGTRTPPTTFDEIPGVNTANALHQTNSNTSKQGAATKDTAADRVSTHGFGSGSLSERARNKGKGRVSIVIGTLYMCAGQWHDAIRELVEGGQRARAFSDHLWHAKALEHIMVCLLLFAWTGVDFQIPTICYPITDKSANIKSPPHTPASHPADAPAKTRTSSSEAALEALNSLLPDLLNMILNLYTRASNFPGESLPPLPFSECVIRFSKLLAAMNLAAGYLDKDALESLVQNTPHKQKPRISVARLSVHPTRHEIASMLFRALPGPVENSGMNPTDRVVVLAGVASVLSSLGLQRKKSIVMMEFITSLIPGLVQARKVGAAEMGVHPAAGLAALSMVSSGSGAGAFNLGESEVESGIDELLGLIGKIYGIPNSKGIASSSADGTGAGSLTQYDSSRSVTETILRTSSLRAFGCLDLKLEVLRLCINFCEALPDFNGLLHFTALLLRVAGPGTAPRPNSTNVYVSLPREEQGRLYNNVLRTMTASKKLGLHLTETEYWDDFLIRGLFIVEESPALRLVHHRPVELKSTSIGKDGPFLHNPWLKRPQDGAAEAVIVANESYRFIISLQNPYDFELEIESLRLAAEGVEFTSLEEHILLGPYRTQKFQIAGTPRSSGTLKVLGCYVKLLACRDCLFPIFTEPWQPELEPKMKKIGLQASLGAPVSRHSLADSSSMEERVISEPTPDILTFTVVPDQPVLVVTGVTLPQSAIMILEGERKQFTVTVRNTSTITAVDFVHISFQDSATAAIQGVLSNKDLPPAELHEVEIQLAHHPSLRWHKNFDEESLKILPGEEMDFTIEVVGRIRLTDAIIQIDYANLGKRRSEVIERFFTRQVSIPISITVNASAQLQRQDIIPLAGEFKSSSQPDQIVHAQSTNTTAASSGSESCLLLLDFRNSWPNPLIVSLQARQPSTVVHGQFSSWDEATTITEVIQPGHINRIVISLPKLYIKNPHAAIPSLNPANQRQFIVSTSKISPEVERQSREAFWYRHELLNLIQGTWTEETTGRHGNLELRGIRFSPRMVEAIKLEDVHISMTLVPNSSSTSQNNSDELAASIPPIQQQSTRCKFTIPTDEFFTLKTQITNRSTHPISAILRLQPHLANLSHTIALDLDKRFSWSGVLQRKLPLLAPGESVASELGVIALCAGTFAVDATVDELEVFAEQAGGRRTVKGDDGDNEGKDDGDGEDKKTEFKKRHHRSATQVLLQFQNGVLGAPKLRSWHAKESCVIVARRGDEEGV